MITMGLSSVAEVYRVIKQFHFDQGHDIDIQSSLTFSDNTLVRWAPENFGVQLKRQSTGKYSDSEDIWFKTWTTNPQAVRKLLMLEIFPEVQEDGAEVYLRINDGTDDYFWDGSAWSVPDDGDWNTEAEINANIETFPILPDRTFAIVCNLRSVDDLNEVTPIVTEIRVLMEVHIDFIEDIILRSMMPALKNGITAVGNYAAIPTSSTAVTTIAFGAYRKNTPYDITTVERVYDLTADPNLLYNLFSSYNPTTEVITLSSALPKNHRAFIVFRYSPEVAFITHQDYYEVNKVPALVIQRVEVPVASSYNSAAREGIVNKTTGAAVVIEDPIKITLQFRLHGITASVVDEMRLMSKVLQFFKMNEYITSTGLDEKYRLFIDKEFRDLSNPNKSDERAFWTQFSIMDIRLPLIATDTYAVMRTTVNISEPVVTTEDPVLGGSRLVLYVHSPDGAAQWTRTFDIGEPSGD